MNKYFRTEIKENISVNKSHNLLLLSVPETSENPVPGQFYMIGTENSYDPFLKRPFSIFRNNPPSPPFSKGGMGGFSNELQFLYRIKGKGTEKMKQMKKGDPLQLLGPLGNGYCLPDKNFQPLIIAGGIGIASLYPLIEALNGNVFLFYGSKTKDDIFMYHELQELCTELNISTDDGSAGEKGTVLDALSKFLTRNSRLGESPGATKLETRNLLLYACGPSRMLEAVSNIALEKGIKGYISLEENMACGVGACLGCAVKTKKGYKRVCKEGPVFSIEEIVWI